MGKMIQLPTARLNITDVHIMTKPTQGIAEIQEHVHPDAEYGGDSLFIMAHDLQQGIKALNDYAAGKACNIERICSYIYK